jgi:hypothetical protein
VDLHYQLSLAQIELQASPEIKDFLESMIVLIQDFIEILPENLSRSIPSIFQRFDEIKEIYQNIC